MKICCFLCLCSQEVLPYTFMEKEGLFNAHTQYGAIKVKRFSILTQTGPKGIDSRITSLKFYKPRPTTRTLVVDFDFVVLYNHEPFLKVTILVFCMSTNICFGYEVILGTKVIDKKQKIAPN